MGRGPDKKPRKRRGSAKPKAAAQAAPSLPMLPALVGGLDPLKGRIEPPPMLNRPQAVLPPHKAELDGYALHKTQTGYRAVYPVFGVSGSGRYPSDAITAAKRALINELDQLKARLLAEITEPICEGLKFEQPDEIEEG